MYIRDLIIVLLHLTLHHFFSNFEVAEVIYTFNFCDNSVITYQYLHLFPFFNYYDLH